MGWTFNTIKGSKTAYVRGLVASYTGARVVDKALVGNHLWLVVQPNDNTPAQIALHLLACHDGCWGDKGLSESCGPTAVDCPLRMLRDVSPPPSPYSSDWRERVLRYHTDKAFKQKVGTRVAYGGAVYVLGASLGRRGREVMREDGVPFRMPAKMLAQAEVLY